jgi:IMP cyclohydrolase
MTSDLSPLSDMRYPGRVIIIGLDETGKKLITIYAVTGRSPSSQSRRIEYEGGKARVLPMNTEILKQGNPELLIYPSLHIAPFLAVSNGHHTRDIVSHIEPEQCAVKTLVESLENWDYEPDKPNYTPRISGCAVNKKRACLNIIKKAANNDSLHYFYDFPLIQGQGRLIATYAGPDRNPLPSFSGEPYTVALSGRTPEETANDVYKALEPPHGEPDFRVAVICVFSEEFAPARSWAAVVNRHERTK